MEVNRLIPNKHFLNIGVLLFCVLFHFACRPVNQSNQDSTDSACSGSDIPCFELTEIGARFTEEEGDNFGDLLSPIGDINGDGFDDILIGDGTDSIYLFYGKSDQFFGDVSSTTADARFIRQDNETVTAISGDVNGDGFNDILFGLPEDQGSRGIAYLFYGGATQFSGDTPLVSADVKFIGENEGDLSGISIAAGGDVNNDGYSDILIGAPGYVTAESKAGAAYLIYGGAEKFPTEVLLTDADVRFDGNAERGGYFGSSVKIMNDINGDGYDDFMITGSHDPTPTWADYQNSLISALFLFYGRNENYATQVAFTSADAIFSWSGFGLFPVSGDLNGDGYYDLLIQSFTGTAYFLYGNETKFTGEISAGYDWDAEFQLLLGSIDFGGDVNGDGEDDVLASPTTVYGDEHDVYLIYGMEVMENNAFEFSTDADLNYRAISSASTFSVSFAGDVNGDGFNDILIGNPLFDSEGKEDAGIVYLIYGSGSFE